MIRNTEKIYLKCGYAEQYKRLAGRSWINNLENTREEEFYKSHTREKSKLDWSYLEKEPSVGIENWKKDEEKNMCKERR